MNLFNTFKNNLDEVVFEQRNKAYGAYAIRKAYAGHVNQSILFTLSPLLLIIAGSIAWNYFHPLPVDLIPRFTAANPHNKPDDRVIEFIDVQFEMPVINTASVYEIKRDELVKEPVDAPEKAKPVEGNAQGEGIETGKINSAGGIGEPSGNIEKPVETTAPVAIYVDNMPEFPGGQKAMYEFIRENIQYPKWALENNIGGKVMLSFVVMPDGSVKMPKLEKGIGFGCDDEALRILNEMPQWTPGSQNGHKVAVRLFLPIKFQTQY